MPDNNPFRDKADKNPFRLSDDVKAKIAMREAELTANETPSPGVDKGLRTFFDTVPGQALSFPGEVLSQGVAGTEAALEGGVSVLTGGDFDFERRANRNMQLPPFAQLNNLPRLTHNQASAAVKQGSESIANLPLSMGRQVHVGSDLLGTERQPNVPAEPFSSRFNEDIARLNQEQARVAEKHPFKVGAGEVGGDIMSLMSLRGGGARGIAQAEKAAFNTRRFADSMTDPGTRAMFEEALDSKHIARLKRATGRVAETTAEATVMSILKDGDPVETAAYAAAGQLVGSGTLEMFKSAKRNPWTAAIAFGALIKMTEEVVPGEEASWVTAIESGWDKVQIAITLGVLATMVGAGRGRGGGGTFDRNMPELVDALATIPRAASISFLIDYTKATPEEQETAKATLNQLRRDPNFFGPEITPVLEKTLETGNLMEALKEPL